MSFREGIYADLRAVRASARFSLAPPEAKDLATAKSLHSENEISRVWQVIDDFSETDDIATFEPDYWRLDGTFALPVSRHGSNWQVGFFSDEISDADGGFVDDPTVMIEFDRPMDCPRFGVAFGGTSGETVCADMRFIALGEGGETLYDQTVTGNSDQYVMSDGGAMGVKSFKLVCIRTLRPFRYARISEIDFGVTFRFEPERIVDADTIIEADPSGKNIRFNSLSLTVLNEGEFDQLDPEGSAAYLQTRQPIELRFGARSGSGFHWTGGGVFYLSGWRVRGATVEFNCLGKAHRLSSVPAPELSGRKSIAALATAVCEKAGLLCLLPDSLWQSPLAEPRFGDMMGREALASIAELSCCLVFEDKTGAIRFVVPETREADDTLTYAQMLSEPEVNLGRYYNGIVLTEYNISGERVEQTRTFYPAPWRDPLEPEYGWAVDIPMMTLDNPALREWFLSRKFELLRRRIGVNISYRGNPAIIPGMFLDTQTNREGRRTPLYVASSSLNYSAGTLSGAIKAVGL